MPYREHKITGSEANAQQEMIKQTLLFWQSRASKNLNTEDARQMIESVTGFFSQLNAWDAAEPAAGLDCSNATDISAISPEAVNEPLEQEDTGCSQAHDSLAA